MRYVIIGGSIAGISAAKAIRENDRDAVVTVISGEATGPYYRPMIPLVVAGQKSEQDILYPANPLEEANAVSLLATAVGVDTNGRNVLLASGERVAYDRLLVASGGVAVKPAVPGLEGTNVHP